MRTRPLRERTTSPRTRRDWYADIAFFLFAAVFSVLSADSVHLDEDMSRQALVIDQVVGALACGAVFLRRRWPVHLALALLVLGNPFHFLAGATIVAMFTVAVHRPLRVTAWVTAAVGVPFVLFLARSPEADDPRTGSALTYFALIAGSIGWGLYVRQRRQMIAALEERAAAEAGRRAREEIAREMHDVLAHRLSLLSVHAGALEFNQDASKADVRHAAGVIRDSAHQALQDLREVIGVLRAPAGDGASGRPQPTLRDVDRLVAESREAGANVVHRGRADAEAALPPVAGRTAYRIVQEGLTNARKHAPGAPVTVTVSGRPGEGLTVEVVNPLADGSGTAIPGASQGLIGLGERVALAGGTLEHGPDDGTFALRARLPWDAPQESPGPGKDRPLT
ncbi:Nitrate/nitrite sensor protein NarX [Streptomyces sp. YIM 130001]|uniref:sensor histidine kinase n=1 Tax=Streptomyces sp. YIM 130001 TaxID=2259644 RepID=UPI000E65B00D|nr:histidine kinase [Streptomyces sp. YIM 130001]RII13783.1 Nitrate/nitrite sensor protein NarX [Streptomyces sp. YIM 130001]